MNLPFKNKRTIWVGSAYSRVDDYTLNGLLAELNQIDSFINDANEFYLSEITGVNNNYFDSLMSKLNLRY